MKIEASNYPRLGESLEAYQDRYEGNMTTQELADFYENTKIRTGAADNEIYLHLSGEVGFDFTASDLREALEMAAGGKLHIAIFSGGGLLFAGLEMYNLLATAKVPTKATIVGLAASAASFLIMGADEIQATESTLFMIHEAWGLAAGSATDLREQANLQEIVQQPMVSAYARRSGKTEADVLSLMRAETWYTATEAKAEGFVDDVLEAKAAQTVETMAGISPKLDQIAASVQKHSLLELPEAIAARLQNKPNPKQTKDSMNAEVTKALGLKADATQAEALAEIATLIQAKAGISQLQEDLQAKSDLVDSLNSKVTDLETDLADAKAANKNVELAALVAEIKKEAGTELADENEQKLTRRAERIMDEDDDEVSADLREDAVTFAKLNGVEPGKQIDGEGPEGNPLEGLDPQASYTDKMAAAIKHLRSQEEYANASPAEVREQAKQLISE